MSEQLVIDGYVEGFVLVDGAVEYSEAFGFKEGAKLEAWLKERKHQAFRDPRHTQIFLTQHDHPPFVEDCACTRYFGQRPYWEYGDATPGGSQ